MREGSPTERKYKNIPKSVMQIMIMLQIQYWLQLLILPQNLCPKTIATKLLLFLFDICHNCSLYFWEESPNLSCK